MSDAAPVIGETDEAAPDPLVGTLLQDKYEVVRVLGRGGMGKVYEGVHTLIGRRVAIKTLHACYAQDPEVVARFRREAQAATAIGNEHIIEVTDLGPLPGGGIFLVLELLEGIDLGDLLAAEGPQPLGRIAHVVTQMCEALTAAHAKGIVHRDLKPDNVFLIRRGGDPLFVKVLDFGISKMRDSEGRSSGMTKTGAPIGTPYYMAPEQARGARDVDHRVDVYALGVILFVALTGRYPFEDESFAALLVRILMDPVPDLRVLRPDVPEEIVALIERMLSKRARERPQGCAEVARALAPFVDRDAPPPSLVIGESRALGATALGASGVRASTASAEGSARGFAATSALPANDEHEAPAPDGAATTEGELALPTTGGGRRFAIAAGLVAIVGLAAYGAYGAAPWAADAGQRTARDVTAPLPGASGEDTHGEAAPPNDDPAADAARVRVHITVEPTDARLAIDGVPVATPYVRNVLPDDVPHTLVAQREGYVMQEREIVFDGALDETIRLTRDPSSAAATRGRRGPRGTRAPEPAHDDGTRARAAEPPGTAVADAPAVDPPAAAIPVRAPTRRTLVPDTGGVVNPLGGP